MSVLLSLFIRAARLYKPLYGAALLLSITSRCQCACSRCAVGDGQRPVRELTCAEVCRLISEAAELGIREVSFFGGEPLLRPELPAIVEFTRSLGLRATLTTNGLLLDERMAGRLSSAGLTRAAISLDDPSSEVHDAGRGTRGAWRNACAGARALRAHGVAVDISFCADRARLRDGRAVKMLEIAASLGARLRILSPMRAGRWNENPEEVLGPEELNFLRSLLSPGRAHWVIETVNSPTADFVCSSLDRWKVDVTAGGDVVPCVYFPVPFGNVRDEGLGVIVKRMWATPLYVRKGKRTDCPLNDPSFRARHGGYFAKTPRPR